MNDEHDVEKDRISLGKKMNGEYDADKDRI